MTAPISSPPSFLFAALTAAAAPDKRSSNMRLARHWRKSAKAGRPLIQLSSRTRLIQLKTQGSFCNWARQYLDRHFQQQAERAHRTSQQARHIVPATFFITCPPKCSTSPCHPLARHQNKSRTAPTTCRRGPTNRSTPFHLGSRRRPKCAARTPASDYVRTARHQSPSSACHNGPSSPTQSVRN